MNAIILLYGIILLLCEIVCTDSGLLAPKHTTFSRWRKSCARDWVTGRATTRRMTLSNIPKGSKSTLDKLIYPPPRSQRGFLNSMIEETSNSSTSWLPSNPSLRVMEAAERSRKQVEYAAKTVASAPPCIALRCKDGVFLAAFTPKALMRLPSRWIKRKRHLFRVTDSISVGLTGIYSDCVRLLEFMRSVASEHKLKLQEEIPSRMLCDAVSERLFEFNNDESMRTLAVSCIIASTPKRLDNITGVTDDDALDYPEIFLVHMDGTYDGSFLATATHAQHSCMDVLKLLRARDWREMTVGEADAEVRSFCASNRSTGPREKILLETWNMPI